MPCPLCRKPSGSTPIRIPVARAGQPDRLLVECQPCGVHYARDYVVPAYESFPLAKYRFGGSGPRFDGFGYHLGLVHRHVLPPGKLLDVGASAGFAVRNAASNGWDASGVEPATELVDWGATHLQIPMSTAWPRGEEQFDVITSSEVIEHVPDPVAWLERLYALQAPGGLLFLTTPNGAAVPGRENPAEWDPTRNPLHCVLFSERGLAGALSHVGWEFVEAFTACGPHDDEMLHVIARKPGNPRVRRVPPEWLRALGATDPRRSVALHEYASIGVEAPVERTATQRLDRLEARLATLETSAQSPSLEAESVILRDPHGRVRAVLGAEVDGAVQLQLFDAEGQARCRMGVDPDGAPLFALADSAGNARLGVLLDETGSPSVGLYDREGHVRGLLALDASSAPQLLAVSDDHALTPVATGATAAPARTEGGAGRD